MDIAGTDYLRFVLALVFVLGLIGGIALLGKRLGFGNQGPSIRRTGARRLAIVESMALDAKRRVVLVRRDDSEHLLLLGTGTDLVIETRIVSPGGTPETVSAEAPQ